MPQSNKKLLAKANNIIVHLGLYPTTRGYLSLWLECQCYIKMVISSFFPVLLGWGQFGPGHRGHNFPSHHWFWWILVPATIVYSCRGERSCELRFQVNGKCTWLALHAFMFSTLDIPWNAQTHFCFVKLLFWGITRKLRKDWE